MLTVWEEHRLGRSAVILEGQGNAEAATEQKMSSFRRSVQHVSTAVKAYQNGLLKCRDQKQMI